MSYYTSEEWVLSVASLIAVALGLTIAYFSPSIGTNILKDFLVFCSGACLAYVWARAGARISSSQLQQVSEHASEQRIQSLCRRAVQRLNVTAAQLRSTALRLRGYGADQITHDVLQDTSVYLESLAQHTQLSIGDFQEAGDLEKLEFDEVVAEIGGITGELPEEAKQKLTMIQSRLERFRPFASRSAPLLITCPGCNGPISVRTKADDPEVIIRNCFKCDRRIMIEKSTLRIVSSEKGTPLQTSYSDDQGKAKLQCPNCFNTIYARLPAADPPLVKASCAKCTHLIHAIPHGAAPPAAQTAGGQESSA
jgi:hypothetical protein